MPYYHWILYSIVAIGVFVVLVPKAKREMDPTDRTDEVLLCVGTALLAFMWPVTIGLVVIGLGLRWVVKRLKLL